MKWWSVGVGLFLLIGLVVAVFSLYRASVDGLMQSLGLVGGDFSVGVVQDKIDQAVAGTKGKIACDLPTRLRGTMAFFLASDQEQGQLSFRLGEARIKCGAVMLAEGEVEVGTYEIVKGMGYLTQGYAFVAERMEIDPRVCEGLPNQEVDKTVEGVLAATSGRVYEIIWDDWEDIIDLREPVVRTCLDQRLYPR